MQYVDCELCGHSYNYLWFSDIWYEITLGKYNYLCPDCFTKMCEERNILIRWETVAVTRAYQELKKTLTKP